MKHVYKQGDFTLSAVGRVSVYALHLCVLAGCWVKEGWLQKKKDKQYVGPVQEPVSVRVYRLPQRARVC